METGILAAEVIDDTLRGRSAVNGLEDAYRRKLQRRFGARYHAYQVAERWAGSSFLLNLLAWRANQGKFVQRELRPRWPNAEIPLHCSRGGACSKR